MPSKLAELDVVFTQVIPSPWFAAAEMAPIRSLLRRQSTTSQRVYILFSIRDESKAFCVAILAGRARRKSPSVLKRTYADFPAEMMPQRRGCAKARP